MTLLSERFQNSKFGDILLHWQLIISNDPKIHLRRYLSINHFQYFTDVFATLSKSTYANHYIEYANENEMNL